MKLSRLGRRESALVEHLTRFSQVSHQEGDNENAYASIRLKFLLDPACRDLVLLIDSREL
jgi:hypothetical protein